MRRRSTADRSTYGPRDGWRGLRERLTAAEPAATVGQPPGLAATLRDYQLRGLDRLARTTALGLGCCLADDMGLGKTITLIALHLHRQTDASAAGPTLVVCPASLLGNWQREIERFAPGTPVRRFHGPGRDLESVSGGEFVLTTYADDAHGRRAARRGALGDGRGRRGTAREESLLPRPRGRCARSAHARVWRSPAHPGGEQPHRAVGDPRLDDTGPARRARRFPRAVRAARRGRPGPRRAAQRCSPGSSDRFCCAAAQVRPGHRPELPPKTETDHPVALTTEQAGLYEALVRETLDRIATADYMDLAGASIVRLLTGLKQICNHPAQFLKEDDPRLAGRSGKLELLDELLGTILAEGSGVLVFTQYVRMARLLERHLAARGVPSLLLHGGTPVAGREASCGASRRVRRRCSCCRSRPPDRG